jgi:hypothetical protein
MQLSVRVVASRDDFDGRKKAQKAQKNLRASVARGFAPLPGSAGGVSADTPTDPDERN